MKTWIIKITSAALIFGFIFTGCEEPRHYERDRDDRHHHRRDRDRHDDNDHHDDDHHDNDNH